MNRFVLLVAAAMLVISPLPALSADSRSDPTIVQAFQPGNESAWSDVPVYIARLYIERFFTSLAASCPRAGIGHAPGHPAAALYVATPTLIYNPTYFQGVQLLKASEVRSYLGSAQAEEDARQFAASSGCNPEDVQRVTSNMKRHLSDPKLAGHVTDTLAAQCKARPNRWDGQPCDCLGRALDMASTPRSRQLLVDDFWGWKESLLDGDSRLFNQTMVACTRSAPISERKPDYGQQNRGQKLLSSSDDAVSTALSTMERFEGNSLPDAVARPLYEHAFPLWATYGERSLVLTCFYGRNTESDDTFVVMFWKNSVFLSRADFAALSPRHPLLLVSETVRKTCPAIEEAIEIRAANYQAAKELGYY